MRSVMGSAIAAVLLAASGLAASNNPPSDHNDAFVPGPENETQIAKQVRHNLLMLPYYSIFDDLAFRLNGTVVTLEGACPPEPPWDIKSDAERAAKKVPGVTQVINNIKLLPLSPMDWQIRRAMVRKIYGNSNIGIRYGYQALPSIHIIVDNGHVTLEGVVDNQFDKTLINTLANQVPYVFSVTNNLLVLNEGNAEKKPKKSS
jgi:hyperosmotically inducible periplasmic protein